MIFKALCCGFVACCLATSFLTAEEPEKKADVSYWKDVRPIFQAHCQGCHQPAKRGGDYVMTSFEEMLKGGESESTAVVPGKPDESYLIGQIVASEGVAEMPKNQPALSEAQVALITNWIADGAKDDTPSSAKLRYDSEHPPQYAGAPVLTSLAFSPDGKWLAVSGYHEVVIHDAEKLKSGADNSLHARLVGMSERIESAVFSPDGKSLAVAGGSPGRLGEIQVWDVPKSKLNYSVAVTYDTCYGASWSPDGKLIAFGCPDNTVRAIDAATGKQVLFNGAHNDWVLDTVFSVKSTNLVTVSRDRSMKLMEVATERFIDNISSITPGALKGGLHAVDRHPTKDELLIGGSDGVPKVYRMFREKARKIGDDFNLIRKYPAIPGRIFDAQFSADGSMIAAGSSYDSKGYVTVYKTDDAKEIAKMQGIESSIYAVAIRPNGEAVVAGGFDGYLYWFETKTGKLLQKMIPVPIDSLDVATK